MSLPPDTTGALPTPGQPGKSNVPKAIALMVLSLFFFSLMDASAKALGQRIGAPMTVWVRNAGQLALVALILLPRLRQVYRTERLAVHTIRTCFTLGATFCFFTSFTVMPLANVIAVINVAPMLITLGAAIFLGERFGPRRAIAIAAGLVGALLILRPGTDVFSPISLLPLLGATFYSGYVLTSRSLGRSEDPWTSLLWTATVGALVTSLIVPFHWVAPDRTALMLMCALVVMGTIGQFLLIQALTVGEAGAVAPFTYAGLIFATFWGLVFFGEFPDGMTLLGALVIVSAGLYVWRREMQAGAAGG